MSISLFLSQSADGQSAAAEWSGGRGTFVAWGTFGGGTSKLQMSPDGGTTWVDVTNVTRTTAGTIEFVLSRCKIRADLSGSTSPTLNTSIF